MLPRFATVMAVTDFSEMADRAIPWAYSIVEAGGEVHLVHILEFLEVPNPLYAHYTSDDLNDPERRRKAVERVEEHLRALEPPAAADRAIRTTVGVGLHATVPEGILEEAQQRRVDAIVLGSHGRTGLGHLVLGSVAERVMRRAHVPILIVPRRSA